MLKINKKVIWMLIIISILLPIFTNILASIPTPITKGDSNTWIGFFGSYFGSFVGGIMGALIAFGVAKFQIEEQKKAEKRQLYVQQLPILIKIKMELKDIRPNLISAKSIYLDGNAPIPIDVTVPMKLSEVNFVETNDLAKIIDYDVQAKLIKLKYFYNDFVKTLAFDTYKNEIAIQKLNSEKDRLERKQKRNNNDVIRLREIMEDLKELETDRELTLSSKKHYLDQLGSNVKLTDELIKKVEVIYNRAKKLASENDLIDSQTPN